jgi:hypothetical protein
MYRFAMHRRQADKSEEREVALQPAGSKATKSRVKREEACSLSLAGMMQAPRRSGPCRGPCKRDSRMER